MNRYKCPACGEKQFSASEKEADKPCIKCGHLGTELQDELEEITAIAELMESGGDI